MSCLHVRDLSVCYPSPRGVVRAVDGVSFDHLERETLALIGETGCGKTTLANAVLRLIPEDATVRGRVEFMGRDLLQFDGKRAGRDPGQGDRDRISEPGLGSQSRSHDRKASRRAASHSRTVSARERPRCGSVDSLERLGLQDVEEQTRKYPFQLSGGMNQRVMIAASMILSPKLLIADEPTKGLDAKNRQSVVEELTAHQATE